MSSAAQVRLLRRIEAVARDIALYEHDDQKKEHYFAQLNLWRHQVMSQPVYEPDNYWQKLKDRMKAIFRQSPNMIKRLEQIEQESAELKMRHAMQSTPNLMSMTGLQPSRGPIPSSSSAVTMQPVAEPYVPRQIISPAQMYNWEAQGWPQGTIAAQVPVAPVVPGLLTGQDVQYSLPPPRGGNWPLVQPEASQGPTHYRRPSDMSMAGHGGDEYQIRWPQTSFKATTPSGESSRSSNYQSEWNNSDGSQSTYQSRCS